MKLVERRREPHPVRHRRRPILNNYSNSLTLKSGCTFVVAPPTVQISSSLSLHRFPQTIHSPFLPLFMWFHISWLLVTVFPSWFMTKGKNCIQVMIQPIISGEMLTTVVEHTDLLCHVMEDKHKEKASRLSGKSTISVIWTVGYKEKRVLFPIFHLPEWDVLFKKNRGEQIYSMC